jgi:hypothetical protein
MDKTKAVALTFALVSRGYERVVVVPCRFFRVIFSPSQSTVHSDMSIVI